MKVTVTYLGKKQTVQLGGGCVKDLLKQMNINPETVLVGKNGEIVLETENLKPGDRIEFIRVISGG